MKVDTSIRNGEIRFASALAGLEAGASYSLHAHVTQDGLHVREFSSSAFQANDLQDHRFAFTAKWRPDRLWDIHTPTNTYEVTLALHRADGPLLDTAFGERFGFREFWIDGKDFYLNGSRIFLSAVPLDSPGRRSVASYEAASAKVSGGSSVSASILSTRTTTVASRVRI